MKSADLARVFPEAQTVLRMLTDTITTAAPGRLRSMVVVGGLALGDVRPETSDVDVVAVVDGPVDGLVRPIADLVRAYPRPGLDAIVLSSDDVAGHASGIIGDRLSVSDGEVRLRADHALRNPVTWRVMERYPLIWYGDEVKELGVQADDDELAAWLQNNLTTYWQSWVNRAKRPTSLPMLLRSIDDAVIWGVSGVTRLHATLTTGDVLSKTAALHYAIDTFGDDDGHRAIISHAWSLRAHDHPSPLVTTTAMRKRSLAIDYVQHVINDALSVRR